MRAIRYNPCKELGVVWTLKIVAIRYACNKI